MSAQGPFTKQPDAGAPAGRQPDSLRALHRDLREGRTSPEALTEAALDRAQAVQGLNAFVHLDADAARHTAIACGRLWRQWRADPLQTPPDLLCGIPMAHKDLFYRPDRAPGCASRAPAPAAAGLEAEVLRRLRTAGGIDLGPLHLSEFAYGPTGVNAWLGPARNPWNPDHVTGGSSSGSAVAVAAGVVPYSLGSDSGGSIRTPASWCGLSGFKPGFGQVSLHGVMALSATMDSVGILARNAEDLALVYSRLCGRDGADPRTQAAIGWDPADHQRGMTMPIRLGVLDAHFYEDLADDVAEGLDRIRGLWSAALSARIVTASAPGLADIVRHARTTLLHEAWRTHARLIERNDALYSPAVLARLLAGAGIEQADWQAALSVRPMLLQGLLDSAFRDAEVLLLPCNPTTAPQIADCSNQVTPQMLKVIDGITRCLRPFNYLGLPALALPGGRSAAGLPFGFQLVGRPGSEASLLALGRRWQNVTEFHLERSGRSA